MGNNGRGTHMETFIIIFLCTILIISWLISIRRRLLDMDENITNTMCQIGIQLFSSFDVLTAIVKLVEEYAHQEAIKLMDTVNAYHKVIDSKSTPEDVIRQETIISTVLYRISLVAEPFSELTASSDYTKCLDAVEGYRIMVRSSHLIYNDSVTKYNREIRRFPTLIAAGIFRYSERKYIEVEEE